jgi:hypothetical protein
MKVQTGDRRVGFESSRVTRRRLASLAATNEGVQEALAPSSFPGLFAGETGVYPALVAERPADLTHNFDLQERMAECVPAGGTAVRVDAVSPSPYSNALVQELDELAQDIVSTPGAGGALLAAYAAQARALSMVVEAASRGQSAPLPATVLSAAIAALTPPQALAGLALL